MPINIYIPLIYLLNFVSIRIEATHFNLTLPRQRPNPETVVQEVQRRVNESISRTQILGISSKDQSSCLTGNPIDDCWRCDPNWQSNRQKLADCGIGFGHDALGGKGGQIYVVTDSSDDDTKNPKPGTLRHAVSQNEPLWIIFSGNTGIKLKQKLMIKSYKTIDGRGANVHVVGEGCISIESVSHVIIHNIHIHHCIPSRGGARSDGDGITIMGSSKIWVDHCSMADCTDGLIDATEGSTEITISNNYFWNHDKVMLLGHNDKYEVDRGMQVTIGFNHFGVGLVERMPRCRLGYFHVVNNDYREWGKYAVGGSGNPTINSQGNRYIAPMDPNAKEVTMRMDSNKREWANWNWRTDGDIMVNGAFFVPSGAGLGLQYSKASSLEPKSAGLIDQLTMNAGVFGDNRDQSAGFNGGGPGIGKGPGSLGSGGSGEDYYGMIYGSEAPPSPFPTIFFSLIIMLLYLLI